MAASKKVPAAPSAIRFGQALSNPRPPSSDKLESAKQFIEAWNDADLAKDFSTSAPHPAGPSRMFQSLHSVQTSVVEANRVFEVTLPNPAFTLSLSICTIPSPRDSGRTTDTPPSKKVIRLESIKLDHECCLNRGNRGTSSPRVSFPTDSVNLGPVPEILLTPFACFLSGNHDRSQQAL